MQEYNITFVVKDWIGITLKAKDEDDAKAKAQKQIDAIYVNTKIDWIDGTHTYCGITNNTLIDNSLEKP